MCNPMAWWAAAAMVAGTYAQHRGAVQAENAAVNVRRAEDARQKGYQQQAEAGLQKNMNATSADTVESGIATNAAQRKDAYAAQAAAAPHAAEQAASGSLGGNKVVADNLSGQLADSAARAGGIGDARAQLGAFGDTMFDTSLLTNRGRQDIFAANSNARQSLRPVEAELGAAAHRGDKMKNLGTLLQIAGSVMSAGAGAGAGAGTAAASGGAAAGGGASAMAGVVPMLATSFIGNNDPYASTNLYGTGSRAGSAYAGY